MDLKYVVPLAIFPDHLDERLRLAMEAHDLVVEDISFTIVTDQKITDWINCNLVASVGLKMFLLPVAWHGLIDQPKMFCICDADLQVVAFVKTIRIHEHPKRSPLNTVRLSVMVCQAQSHKFATRLGKVIATHVDIEK
ncbi:hypothetical protein D9M68_18890 [compost metagenome]